jgi:citrate lyase subunit beta / citryl-CoA lyase
MMLRSWLVVPADSEKKLGLASGTGADAVILDLADLAGADAREAARAQAGEWLKARRQHLTQQREIALWVRINPLDSRLWRDDLMAVLPGAPDGIVLPKASGPEAVQQLGAELYELEQRCQVPSGSTRIMPLVGGTAGAAVSIPGYVDAPLPRLGGLAWGTADLASAIRATRIHDGKGWSTAFAFVRAQTLLTAHARAIAAIDAQSDEVSDLKAFKATAEASRADGFTGMLAIHPAQVPIINLAFTPAEAELEEARSIVGAFESNKTSGLTSIDRRLIDRPTLEQARRVLGLSV